MASSRQCRVQAAYSAAQAEDGEAPEEHRSGLRTRRGVAAVGLVAAAAALAVAVLRLAPRAARPPPGGFLGLQGGAVAEGPGECAAHGENCWMSRCCADPGHTCFMKDSMWAGCRAECTPGVQKSDPPEARAPWTCYIVPVHGDAFPQLGMAPSLAPEGDEDEAPSEERPAEFGEAPTLFCFAIIRAKSYELGLVQQQRAMGGGIFICEEWSVLADEAVELAPGVPATVLGDVSTGAGRNTHFANTDVFSRAFDVLRSDSGMLSRDFVVKVDPDAVFMPMLLKREILKHSSTGPAPNLYFQNCRFQNRLWMFGAIEVLSKAALNAYFEGRDTVCRRALDYDGMGEDTFLSRCLDAVGVRAVQDFDLLADGYCNEAPGARNTNQVAYHPFKDKGSWAACFRSATNAARWERVVALKK